MTLVPHLPERLAALEPYVGAGVFDVADVRVTDALDATFGPLDPDEMLAAALAVRAPTHRHVCADLSDLGTQFADAATPDDADAVGDPLWWPEPDAWRRRLESSVLTQGDRRGPGPLRLVGGRVYLARMERHERRVADVIADRVAAPRDPAPSAATLGLADALFGPATGGEGADDLQRRAALAALDRRLLVLGGGPGTGKTRTIAAMLTMLMAAGLETGRRLEVALAAPTGKAAARLTEAIRERTSGGAAPPEVLAALSGLSGSTLHRLLGARRDGSWRHDAENPLPHDVVIVDEASMVALPLMARLFEALAPEATLVLVGDPFQLASVEAGTVLADIIGPAREEPDAASDAHPALADSIVVLRTNHRFEAGSAIGAAATAMLARDADAASAALTERPDLETARAAAIDHATDVAIAARSGEVAAALDLVDRLGFLCASWKGPGGVDATNAAIAEGLVSRLADPGAGRTASAGSVVMVTTNNPSLSLFNGDVGVVCMIDGRTRVAFPGADGPRCFAPHAIGETIPAWAITVHRSQGSEYDHVIVSLPRAGSPLLTRELLYTAVTRARGRVEVVGSDDAVAQAVRRDIRRASGLRERLWA